jgi:polyvinyl alcohol dehydrogenase (cytochrome)
MAPETILQAITKGAMRVHAEDATDEVRRAMAEYLSGRKLGAIDAGAARSMPNQCSRTQPTAPAAAAQTVPRDPASTWNGWSPDATNARFQRASGLAASNLPRLALKWAFGFPGVSSVYGQPTVVGGRVFVGVDTGYVYALDAARSASVGLPVCPRDRPPTSATSAPTCMPSMRPRVNCCGR